jgi:LmeA-like phospholipid-binding
VPGPRRRHDVTRLLAIVVLLALLLGAADVASRIAIQHQLEQRIDSYLPTASTQVRISSFPFLAKVAGTGRVDKVTVHARHVSQGDFVLDRVDVTVTGVKINRSLLLHQRQLEIVSIAGGTVNVDMTQADFARLVGVPVTLGSGVARVTVGGVPVTGRVSVVDGRLRLDAAGLPVSVPIPSLPVLPCLAQVTIVPGHIVGSCTFHEIPAALRLALP